MYKNIIITCLQINKVMLHMLQYTACILHIRMCSIYASIGIFLKYSLAGLANFPNLAKMSIFTLHFRHQK